MRQPPVMIPISDAADAAAVAAAEHVTARLTMRACGACSNDDDACGSAAWAAAAAAA